MKNRGISLILLVITIIVIIILAGTIVLSLSKNNIVLLGKKSVFLNDIKIFSTELNLYKTAKYSSKMGEYYPGLLFADELGITYNSKVESGDITSIITSLKGNSKYINEFEIIKGNLWYKGIDETRKEWAKNDAKIGVNEGNPIIQITTKQLLPIKPSRKLEYSLKISSNYSITNILLDNNIEIIDENNNKISKQPLIIIKEIIDDSSGLIKTVKIEINTAQLGDGLYNIKLLANAIETLNGKSNEEVISNLPFIIDSMAPDIPDFITTPANLSSWVNTDILVEIIKSGEQNKLQYKLEGDLSYKEYVEPICISENTKIYAKEIDEATNASQDATLEITKIDKKSPLEPQITVSIDDENIQGEINLLDDINGSGIDFNKSKFLIDLNSDMYLPSDEIWNNANIINNQNKKINESKPNGIYYIHVLAVDMAGNKVVSRSSQIEVLNIFTNIPDILEGMTPIKWNKTEWIDTTINDKDWYNYKLKQWANARTQDGSFWVWIPRYEYKIPSQHTSMSQEININFLKGTSYNSTSGYTIHPAFTFGDDELTGIWVAKFEASGTTNAIDIKPGVTSLRNLNISDMYNAIKNMQINSRYGWETSKKLIDTHLMKNTEWGAISYLSSSRYGKNSEVWINPNQNYITGEAGENANSSTTTTTNSYNTINGMQASTTGNITGIYDMSGGASEYTAAYINNGNSNLSKNGSSLINALQKYKDIYTSSGDTTSGNYTANSIKKGDAVYETSISYTNSTAWYNDYSYMPYSTNAFFGRGGYCYDSTNAGIFAFGRNAGGANLIYSFRIVLNAI